MIVGYERNGSVYYDYNDKKGLIVASNAEFVSVSGNFIVYEKSGHVYKAEVDENGYIRTTGILVR